jgi:hypothetical protein
MTTYAYIRDGIVFNIAEFDGEQTAEHLEFVASKVGADEVILATEGCMIDGTYASGVFTRKPEPVRAVIVSDNPTPGEL